MVGASLKEVAAAASPPQPNELISSAILPRRILFHPPLKTPPAHSSSSVPSLGLTPLNDPPPPLPSHLPPSDSSNGGFLPSSSSPCSTEEPLPSSLVKRIGAGLHNLGNTCFLNAVLQCLTYTPPLSAYFQEGLHKASCRVVGFCAMCALENHTKQALLASGRVISPNQLVKNLRCISRSFQMGRQEDAHEYMRYLIEALQKCCPLEVSTKSSSTPWRNFVQKIFGGRLRSQVKCSQCSYSSNTYDPFLDLSLDIVRADSLLKALARFTAIDVLDGENKYHCSRCKTKVRAHKQFTIDTAPHVLTVQFKRFSSSGGFGGKIDKKVDFGRSLDLKPYVNGGEEGMLNYKLYAVLVHAGWSTHSGHYYCFVRTATDMWHRLDDTRVSQVSEKSVLEQKAYILFYVRDTKATPAANGHGDDRKRTSENFKMARTVGIHSSDAAKAEANGTTSQVDGATVVHPRNIKSDSSNGMHVDERLKDGIRCPSNSQTISHNGAASQVNTKAQCGLIDTLLGRRAQLNGFPLADKALGNGVAFPRADRPSNLNLAQAPINQYRNGLSASEPLPLSTSSRDGHSQKKIKRSDVALCNGNGLMKHVCQTPGREMDANGVLEKKLESSPAEAPSEKARGVGVKRISLPLKHASVPRWEVVDDCKGGTAEAENCDEATPIYCGHILDEWDEEYDRGKRKKVRNKKAVQGLEGMQNHKRRKIRPTREEDGHGNPFQIAAGIKSQVDLEIAQAKKHKKRQRTPKLFLKRHWFKQLSKLRQHRRKH